MIKDSKELQQISGLGREIEIQGKRLRVSPLRLRDIIALTQYEDGHIPLEVRAYSVFLHLRENPEITFESILDMEMSDITKIIEFCDTVLYPDKKKDDESKNA